MKITPINNNNYVSKVKQNSASLSTKPQSINSCDSVSFGTRYFGWKCKEIIADMDKFGAEYVGEYFHEIPIAIAHATEVRGFFFKNHIESAKQSSRLTKGVEAVLEKIEKKLYSEEDLKRIEERSDIVNWHYRDHEEEIFLSEEAEKADQEMWDTLTRG